MRTQRTLLFTISALLLTFLTSGAAVHRVDTSATGAADGSTWTDAFPTLQAALTAAGTGDEIWVAAGTYKPNDADPANLSREQWFQMKNGVTIYGGFAGGEALLSDRDPATNQTILSGDLSGDDLDGDGDGFPDEGSMAENTYHVFYHPSSLALDESAVLDGFTVRGGNADGSGFHKDGGGIYCLRSSPRIRNCLIDANYARDNGGGLYFYSHSYPTSMIVETTTFRQNRSESAGGGIFLEHCNFTATNCTFTRNLSIGSTAGAVYVRNSSSVFAHCTISAEEGVRKEFL